MLFPIHEERKVLQNAHLRHLFETSGGGGESDPVPPRLQDILQTHFALNPSKQIISKIKFFSMALI